MEASKKSITNHGIDYLLRRGVAEIIIEDELVEMLRSGKKLRLKEGFDPSFPDIHLGHVVALRKLRQFQELGHQVILIVGDWTAQIGDPSGASVTRPMLSAEKVRTNAESYMKQFFKVVDRSRTEVRWQSEWFGNFTLADVIQLTSKFTVAQMLARDDFSARYNAGRPIAVTELLYPLLQAYDSVAIQADVEFGGTDQKFNFLVGRELQTMVGQRPQQCLMTPLLVGTDGTQKMSKSLGNYIGVDEPPAEIYGKAMSISDSLILQYFELVTDVPDQELEEFRQELNDKSFNPMTLKKRLAREIVTQLYSQQAASDAEDTFEKVVQQKEVPEEIPEYRVSFKEAAPNFPYKFPFKFPTPDDIDLSRLFMNIGLAKSRSEAHRLIEQRGVEVDGEKVTNYIAPVKSGSIIKVGKRRFVKVINIDKTEER